MVTFHVAHFKGCFDSHCTSISTGGEQKGRIEDGADCDVVVPLAAGDVDGGEKVRKEAGVGKGKGEDKNPAEAPGGSQGGDDCPGIASSEGSDGFGTL